MVQAHLGGVAHGGKHGFAEKNAAHGDAVKAADKLAVMPGFDAMSIPQGVKLNVGVLHFRRNPSALSILHPKAGAIVDDLVEGGIKRDLIDMPADRPFERSGWIEFVWVEHHARIG